MRAGKLRHRLEVQSLVESRDAHGGAAQTWTTDATRWGSVEPLTAREHFTAQQVASDVTHRVRLRFYSGLTAAQRFKWGTRVLNIKSILNAEERDIEQEILCTESTGGA